MAGIAIKCSNCGALVTASDPKYCSFCGAVLTVDPSSAPARVLLELAINAPQRFEEAERSPRLTALMEQEPVASGANRSLGPVLMLAFLIVIGFALTVKSGSPGFLLISAAATFFLVSHIAREARIAQLPIDRKLMVVMDERTKIQGGGENNPARTRYYALLESKDGDRREFEIGDELAGRLTRGDIGVAYMKADRLVTFAVLEI